MNTSSHRDTITTRTSGQPSCTLSRNLEGWQVNGVHRPHESPGVKPTPFCLLGCSRRSMEKFTTGQLAARTEVLRPREVTKAIGTVWLARAEAPDPIQLGMKLAATICKLPLTICMGQGAVSIRWDTPKRLDSPLAEQRLVTKGKCQPRTTIKSKTSPLRCILLHDCLENNQVSGQVDRSHSFFAC